MRRRAFAAANTSAPVMNLTSNGLLFLLTRYLQSVLDHSALDAGIMLLPLFIPLAALSPLTLTGAGSGSEQLGQSRSIRTVSMLVLPRARSRTPSSR